MTMISSEELDEMILAWALVRDSKNIVTFAEEYAERMGWGTLAHLEQIEYWSAVMRAHMRYVEDEHSLKEQQALR